MKHKHLQICAQKDSKVSDYFEKENEGRRGNSWRPTNIARWKEEEEERKE